MILHLIIYWLSHLFPLENKILDLKFSMSHLNSFFGKKKKRKKRNGELNLNFRFFLLLICGDFTFLFIFLIFFFGPFSFNTFFAEFKKQCIVSLIKSFVPFYVS